MILLSFSLLASFWFLSCPANDILVELLSSGMHNFYLHIYLDMCSGQASVLSYPLQNHRTAKFGRDL